MQAFVRISSMQDPGIGRGGIAVQAVRDWLIRDI
jgi:hypothetical protein